MDKHTVVLLGCIEFYVEETNRAWSTIDGLVKDSTHCDIAGICGEEKGCVRGWRTQARC